jgi:hypothetical protein
MKAPPYIHASLRVASEMALQIFGVGMLVCVICLSSFAQANNGRILGIITDQSGGATAGATITVTDTRRGTSRAAYGSNWRISAAQLIAGDLFGARRSQRFQERGARHHKS